MFYRPAWITWKVPDQPVRPCLEKEREGRREEGYPEMPPPQTKGSPKPDLVLAARVSNARGSRVGCWSLAAFVLGGEHLLCVLSYLGTEKQVSLSNSSPVQKELTTKFHIPVLLLHRLGYRVSRVLLPGDIVDIREGIPLPLEGMKGQRRSLLSASGNRL